MTKKPIDKSSVLYALSRHVGKGNGASVIQIAQQAGSDDPQSQWEQRRVRHLITELRLEGHHICATPTNGYFVAKTTDELDETCEWLYSRAIKSLQQISKMKKVSLPDLRGQLRLPLATQDTPRRST